MDIDGLQEVYDERKKQKENLEKQPDLFDKRPGLYYMLWIFLILGSAYFLLNLLGVIGVVGFLT